MGFRVYGAAVDGACPRCPLEVIIRDPCLSGLCCRFRGCWVLGLGIEGAGLIRFLSHGAAEGLSFRVSVGV